MINRINSKSKISLLATKLFMLSLLVSAILPASCSKPSVYNEFKPIDPTGWSADSSHIFSVDIKDSTALYDLWVNIRHNGNYPYQNLWLFVEQLSPDSLITRDTLACALSDHTGRWTGTGSGSLYLLTLNFKQQFKFDGKGTYRFSIVHGMRDKHLKGIHAIGLKLDYHHGKK